MILCEHDHWLRLLFMWRGSVLPRLLALVALSVAAILGQGPLVRHHLTFNAAPFPLFGVALAVFLGFYTVSYDRFWEGRRLWGMLLNAGHSLARLAPAAWP